MSIQAECRAAMNRLAAQGKLFTEIDVANEASQQEWSNKNFEQAVRDAYNVLQGDYKRGKLVRFGPVKFNGNLDYARRGSKIVYADSERGPKEFRTPNGVFPRLLSVDDSMSSPGRKSGTNRDDTRPWDGQTVSLKRTEPRMTHVDPEPLLRRIEELEGEIRRLHKQKNNPASNGNGNGHSDADSMTELADLLVPEVVNKAVDQVKMKLAEALIDA